MKTMKTLRSQSGFSLIELMVVVAIIGILATMSVGAVQKQIAKSRQSEVKTNLSSLYTSSKAFQAEFASYATRFSVIGAAFDGNMRYNIGFNNDVGIPAGYTGNLGGATMINAVTYCPAAVAAGGGAGSCTIINTNGTPPGAVNPVASTAIAFTAQGRAAVYNTVIDIWTIDNNKTVANGTPGIP